VGRIYPVRPGDVSCGLVVDSLLARGLVGAVVAIVVTFSEFADEGTGIGSGVAGDFQDIFGGGIFEEVSFDVVTEVILQGGCFGFRDELE
jgi:hypothetical protein